MSDRYQQLVNTPVGKIVSKQIGLPNPVKLERYERGQPVISGPVLLGAAPGGRLAGATGGRIVAGLAKALSENGSGRGLISICAAGGLGVTAIMEAAA